MILVTGSLGLVGSECVKLFLEKRETVVGVDNNMRKKFFGADGDVEWNQIHHDNYTFYRRDIRDCRDLIKRHKPDVIIHCAGQPSHDWATENAIMDFSINAKGTLELLEGFRKITPEGTFIYVSTNKVYGDTPNKITMWENTTRMMPYDMRYINGVSEKMCIDNSMHSLFGVSKLAGDLLAQEYGKYFGLNVGIFRCGCITGIGHSAVPLHGFLAYVAKCAKEDIQYTIYGHNGKQVRDIIHAYDLANAFYYFTLNPKKGEVYNMGGGEDRSISVLEALAEFGIENSQYVYVIEPRKGDHQWYISNVKKFQRDYPMWDYKFSLKQIIEELKCVR